MDRMKLHIRGFKCFKDDFFELNRLTLFTGANASGKSSVIQVLLLLKAVSDSADPAAEIQLENPRYAFDFGNPDTLINNEYLDDVVSVRLDHATMSFDGSKQGDHRKLSVCVDELAVLQMIFADGLDYFCAERQGPRFEYNRKSVYADDCGCHGENVGNVMSDNWNTKVAGSRLYKMNTGESLFNVALDQWVDYIFPGIAVKVQQVGSQNYQVIIRDSIRDVSTNSTNIGFGITYALPVLVGGLLAKDGGWLIVENPEAHIHAKAQSNMGYFLGMMAASGLRVVVETHSEHIVNGVRRAALVSGRLEPDDVDIYFFKGKTQKTLITIDEHGNLSDFPVDFFDQSRQDMLEIVNCMYKR